MGVSTDPSEFPELVENAEDPKKEPVPVDGIADPHVNPDGEVVPNENPDRLHDAAVRSENGGFISYLWPSH